MRHLPEKREWRVQENMKTMPSNNGQKTCCILEWQLLKLAHRIPGLSEMLWATI